MPDEFLTIDEVAQRMALPPDMIRRRIESGDIPVHWVESYGKLEMRVAAEDVGGVPATAPAQPVYAPEPGPEPGWEPAEPEGQGLWAPADSQDATASPWEVASEAAPAPLESDDQPVWRPDPATWEDEQLASAAEPAAETAEFGSPVEPAELISEPEISPYASSQEAEFVSPFATPPLGDPAAGGFQPPDPDQGFAAPPAPGFLERDQDVAGAEVEFQEARLGEFPSAPEEEFGSMGQQAAVEEEPFSAAPFQMPEVPAQLSSQEAMAPPSTLLASPAAASAAMGTIDARELVAGLFERWERALEQRIQAEQRLRFEAELEQRLRQVRDLRQELDQTRKTQAAELAEREREVLQLRERVRDLEQAPKRRGLFGR